MPDPAPPIMPSSPMAPPASAPAAPPQTVRLVDPDGIERDVPVESAGTLLQDSRWKIAATADTLGRLATQAREVDYGGIGGAALASGAAIARGATLGGSDVVARAIGGEDTAFDLSQYREENPGLSFGGELAGAVLPSLITGGAAAPAGAASALGRGVARVAGGGLRGAIVGGAAEGAIFGAGQGVSELALSQDPLTLEHAAAAIGSNALYGAGIGAAAGGALHGVAAGLGAAKRSVDRFVEARDAAKALADSSAAAGIADLDAKGLRAARDIELDNLAATQATERSAARSAAVDDVISYRQTVKDANPWLVVNEGEPSKQLNKANNALRAALDDPQGLRESPGPLLKPLRIEEQALQHAVENRAAIAAKLDETNAKIAGELETQLPRVPATEAPPAGRAPAGFDVNGSTETGRIFNDNPTVRTGAPERGALDSATYRDNAYVIRPSELKGPRLRGITSGDDMVADARTAKIRAAWGNGESVPALEIDVDPKGRYFVADGNHRMLAAALEGDRPMLARFRPVEAGVGKMDRIGGELSRALKLGGATKAGAPTAEITLTGRAARRYAAFADVKVPKGKSITVPREEAQRFMDALKSGQVQSDSRAALDKLDGLLEQNRALQAKIKTAAAPLTPRAELTSERLTAIAAARDALTAPKTESVGAKVLGHAAYGAAAGLLGGIPLVGHLLAPVVGSKVADAVTGAVNGLSKAAGAGAERAARAASTFLGKAASVAGKAADLAPPVATKVLAALRYGEPETDERGRRVAKPEPKTLPELYKARTDEIKSQVQLAPDGTYQMKPAARLKMAARLSGLGVVDPIAADRIESAGAARIAWLASQMPRRPDLAGLPVGPDNYQPSDAAMRSWARKAAAAEDPYGVLERASAGAKARVVPEEIMAMRALHSEILNDYITQIIMGLPERKTRLPYAQRLALSMLTGRPLDPAMTPAVMRELQSMFASEPGTAGGTMAPRPSPQFGSVKRSDPGTPAQRRQGVGL